jgi:hypothetical protein
LLLEPKDDVSFHGIISIISESFEAQQNGPKMGSGFFM